VRAWLATFLNHRNRSPWVQLFGADGGGQARGTASHDHEVLVPRCFRNHGNYVISLGNVVKWLAQHAQELGAFGGGFIYHHERNRVSLGFVVGLDYRNPWRSPYEEFQR
jgi:flavin-dependent dehydrogenase